MRYFYFFFLFSSFISLNRLEWECKTICAIENSVWRVNLVSYFTCWTCPLDKPARWDKSFATASLLHDREREYLYYSSTQWHFLQDRLGLLPAREKWGDRYFVTIIHCAYVVALQLFQHCYPFWCDVWQCFTEKILSLKLLLVFRYHFPRFVEKVVFLIFSLVINIHSSWVLPELTVFLSARRPITFSELFVPFLRQQRWV